MSGRYPLGGVKVGTFSPQAQQAGLVLGFWWFLVLQSSLIYANNTLTTPNQNFYVLYDCTIHLVQIHPLIVILYLITIGFCCR
jgi:hypothetical protein